MTIPLRRLVPPASTLISDCPIKAQPPWPPVNPDAKFPSPWPMHSWRVEPLLPSSAMPSTNCNVSRLSTCVEIKFTARVDLSTPSSRLLDGVAVPVLTAHGASAEKMNTRHAG